MKGARAYMLDKKGEDIFSIENKLVTRGSVGWAYVAILSFCFEKTYTEPSIGASYQISVHLATRFQRRIFFRNNQKKRIAYGGHLC